MYALMEQSDGSTSLREVHVRLFHQAPSYEQMAMAAIVFNKGAQILGRVSTAIEARTAWSCVVNLFDGMGGQEEMVKHFRRMLAQPDAMDDSQWILLCRKTALEWCRHAEQFMDAAREMKRTR